MYDRFHRLKFKNLHDELFDDVIDKENQMMRKEFDENKFDMIIFNLLDADQIDAYAKRSNKDIFIGYALEQLKVKQREKFNFVNSPVTLYARTMEALEYQYVTE